MGHFLNGRRGEGTCYEGTCYEGRRTEHGVRFVEKQTPGFDHHMLPLHHVQVLIVFVETRKIRKARDDSTSQIPLGRCIGFPRLRVDQLLT